MLATIASATFARPVQPFPGPPAAKGEAPTADAREPRPAGAGGRSVGGAPPRGLLNVAGVLALQEDAAAKRGANRALSEAEQREVRELKARDREVRAHEQAHARAGGPYAGAPRYDYEMGPDGRQYAVGGEVSIDASPVPDDPNKTIEKMRTVKAAALAPAEPSGQDRRVAAKADAERLKAQAELTQQKADQRSAGQPAQVDLLA